MKVFNLALVSTILLSFIFTTTQAGTCVTDIWIAKNNAPDWKILNAKGLDNRQVEDLGTWQDCYLHALKRAEKETDAISTLVRVEKDNVVLDFVDGVVNNPIYKMETIQTSYVSWEFEADFNGIIDSVYNHDLNGEGMVTRYTKKCLDLKRVPIMQKGSQRYTLQVDPDDLERGPFCTDFNHY